MELRTVALDYADLPVETALTTFLEEVALVSDVDNLDEKVNAPTLLTLHAAKGLEYRVVFIVGMEEKLFPHSRSMEDPEQMEKIADSIPDPAGLSYMYSLPTSLLTRKQKR